MQYLKIKNWEDFQHYKDRNPPWIKLHRTLLTDYEFNCLQDASKLHLMLIWLLASQTGNRIPNDPRYLQHAMHLDSPPNLKELIDKGFLVMEQDASKPLAEGYQAAMLETETEAEAEADITPPPAAKAGKPPKKRFKPPTVSEVSEYCESRNNGIDAEHFVSHYEANGWMRGKAKIKDWKACVRTWEKNNRTKRARVNATPVHKSEVGTI